MNHENAAASCSLETSATTIAIAAAGMKACSAVTFQPPWYEYSLRGPSM